jgi:hypothetical protein
VIDITACITIGCTLIGCGVTWGTLATRLAKAEERIQELEGQQADKTAWAVSQHEKRLDAHDQLLIKIGDKLETITVMLERIDQRTANN